MASTSTKIKRLPTQVFIGAYQGVTAAREIERLVTDEEWDAQSVICTNMAIATKDIAGRTKIRELGNPEAMEAAASGAILGGLIGGVSRMMVGYSKRPSVLAIANDETLFEEEKALAASKRPSIVAKVAEHQIKKMEKTQLAKIGAALIPGSSAIVCVFDEVLVKESDYDNHMQEHKAEMSDLTDHVTTKIHEQLRNGNDVAFHVVVDESTGQISWTRTVIGEDAIQVRDIVMSHNSLALQEVTTTTTPSGDKEVETENVVVTPESVATARTLLRNSVCAYEVSYEDLLDDEDEGIQKGDQEFETGLIRKSADGQQSVLYQKGTVKGGEASYESKFEVNDGKAIADS